MKNQIKERKGITLIGLIVTIIILLILAGVTVMTLTGDNGLLTKAGEAKNISEKGEIEEQIKLAYNDWKLRKETGETVDLQNTVQTALDKMYDNVTISKQGKSIIINVKGNEFTLIDDGTMEEGKLAYLDIADGSIQLKSNGYIQGSNALVPYTGKYIIIGTTTENTVRVMEEGTYNITIKNLSIDVSNLSSDASPINANAGSKAQRCYVNITLEGNNVLYSKGMAGIHFCGGRADTQVETERSTLTLKGNGYLDTGCKAGYDGAGIGGNYNANVPVCDIVINSGNIKAIGRNAGSGIGAGLSQSVGNITINGGNIYAEGGYSSGIGTYNKTVEILKLNGGNVIARGGEYCGGGIYGIKKLEINGGNLKAELKNDRYNYNAIKCKDIMITGGNIKARSAKLSGIACEEGGSINITGGNVYAKGKDYGISTYDSSSLVPYMPKSGTNNLYETSIKLDGVAEGKKITNFTTSDNIEYGIKDMFTLENGMLYLYLPTGSRTITIEVDGKTYSGSVQTTETPAEVILNEIN